MDFGIHFTPLETLHQGKVEESFSLKKKRFQGVLEFLLQFTKWKLPFTVQNEVHRNRDDKRFQTYFLYAFFFFIIVIVKRVLNTTPKGNIFLVQSNTKYYIIFKKTKWRKRCSLFLRPTLSLFFILCVE